MKIGRGIQFSTQILAHIQLQIFVLGVFRILFRLIRSFRRILMTSCLRFAIVDNGIGGLHGCSILLISRMRCWMSSQEDFLPPISILIAHLPRITKCSCWEWSKKRKKRSENTPGKDSMIRSQPHINWIALQMKFYQGSWGDLGKITIIIRNNNLAFT